MRITGLASGMDTESMIKDMMKAQRMPLDKIFQKKQFVEWQRDDYREVNRKLFDFRNLVSDTLTRQSTYIKKTVTSSNPDAVTVKNLSSTADFTGTISATTRAKAATMQSTELVAGTGKIDSTKSIASQFGITGTQTFTVNAMQLNKTTGEPEMKSFTYEFVAEDTTLDKLMEEVNKKSGVTMFYDSFADKMAITNKQTGDIASGSEIEISGSFQSSLNLDATNDLAVGANRGTTGQNATVIINGLATQRYSNTFQLNGYEITLKQDNFSDVSFTSAPDTETILDNVVKVVDAYNKLIEDLNKEIREKKYRDFPPLTDEQKKDLKDKEIELWEEKAKSGTLRNDSIISGTLNEMRTIFNGSVNTSSGKISIRDIGIKPSTEFSDNGKLIIDEGKLRAAISADPNKIYELFSNDEDGIGEKLVSSLDDTRKDITSKAGSTSAGNNTFILGKSIISYDEQINRFEDKLKMIEDRYYRQFGAMEKAIQQANQQSAYLMNAFGGGQQ